MCTQFPNQGQPVPGVQDPAVLLKEKIADYRRALNAKEIISFSILVRGFNMQDQRFCTLHVAYDDQVFFHSLLPQLMKILQLMADHTAAQRIELLTSNQKPE